MQKRSYWYDAGILVAKWAREGAEDQGIARRAVIRAMLKDVGGIDAGRPRLDGYLREYEMGFVAGVYGAVVDTIPGDYPEWFRDLVESFPGDRNGDGIAIDADAPITPST